MDQYRMRPHQKQVQKLHGGLHLQIAKYWKYFFTLQTHLYDIIYL